MAKIVIQGLPQTRAADKPYKYTDLHLDLQEQYLLNDNFNQRPEINDIKVDHDIDAIKNSIKNIFYTSPGEKILNPEFGLDLRQFLFEPITSKNADLIRRIIFGEIERFEPRIVVRYVDVAPVFDRDEYNISLTFAVPTLNITDVRLFGALNKSGYYYV